MASARHGVHIGLGGSAAGNAWSILAGVVCLIFFAPLFGLAYLMARAGGPPALIGRRRARRDGTSFMAWRFNIRGRDTGGGVAGPIVEGQGFARFGRFLYMTRLEVLPHLISVTRGDMALAEVFREI